MINRKENNLGIDEETCSIHKSKLLQTDCRFPQLQQFFLSNLKKLKICLLHANNNNLVAYSLSF